jgi:hypothetical protein
MMETILKPTRAHQLGRHAAHVAEALNHHAAILGRQAEHLQRLQGDDHAAAAGGLRAAARAAQRQRLAGHHGRHGVARVHGVGVHDPGHHLLVGVDVGRGHVALGSDEVDDLGGVAARELLQFGIGEQLGSQITPPLPPPKGMLTTAHFQVIHEASARTSSSVTSGAKRMPPLAGPARERVLHAVAGEDLDAPVVQLHRDVDGDLLGGTLVRKHFAHAVVER